MEVLDYDPDTEEAAYAAYLAAKAAIHPFSTLKDT
jgi:hypothetical protein